MELSWSSVFNGYFATADLRQVTEWFDLGGTLQVDDTLDCPRAAVAHRPQVQGLDELTSHAGVGANADRLRCWPRQSTSSSRGSTRRRRSPAPTSSSIRRAERRAAPARPGPSADSSERDMPMPGTRRSTTTESDAGRATANFRRRRKPHAHSGTTRIMKYRYSKFTGDELDELDLEELLSKLSDLLLSSGFDEPVRHADDEDERHRCRRCTTRSSRRCSTAACCRRRRSSGCSAGLADGDRRGGSGSTS